jgi:nitroreductase
MDTITAIRTLRVVRNYADKPLTEDEVRAIADSARKTGSSKNTQRWDFVTIRDRVSLARLSGVTIYAKHLPSAGGAIALVRQGDIIEIDIPRRSINVALSTAELDARRQAMDARGDIAWRPEAERPRKVTPALKVYAKMVTSADKGAVRDLSLLD